ncbi:glycosyl hydrolase, partial [Enterococcus faecalis]|nr:glycosyl hydrolase [Enterococcus faecalis]
NFAELQQAKSPLGRLVFLVLNTMRKRNEKNGKLDLNLLFIWNMPFRGIAKMTNGMVSMAMIDQLLIICNGHFFKGSFGLCRAFIRNKKLQRKYKKQLSQLH